MQPQNSDASGSHVIWTMENVFCFLNSYIESWLSFGLAFLDTCPNYIRLSAAGLLLLYLWYLILKLLLLLWKSVQDIREGQGRSKKGRRRSFRGHGLFQREVLEKRKLLSVVRSPWGQRYDTSRVRQLLCQDPHCDVCNQETAKLSSLLSQAALEDIAASVSSTASATSMTESSLTLSLSLSANPLGLLISDPPTAPPLRSPSVLSDNQDALSEDRLSAQPLCDSPQAKSIPPVNVKFPLVHDPLHPLPSLPLQQQHAAQEAELHLQPPASLSQVGIPRELVFTNVPINKGFCTSRNTMSEVLPQQTDADLSRLESANLTHLDVHSSETYLKGKDTMYLTLSGKLFSSLGVLVLLESQSKGIADAFKTWGKTSESGADEENRPVSCPLGISSGEPGGPHMLMQRPHFKASEGQLESKHIQLFCRPASPHRESKQPSVWAECSSASTCFSRISDFPVLPYSVPLPLPESQSDTLTQTLSQSQSTLVSLAKFQDEPQPAVRVLSPSPLSQLRICGVYFHRPRDEPQPLGPSEIHSLEYNILKKEQERVWGLPAVVKRSQEEFCPFPPKPSLVRQCSKTRAPRTISSEDFPLLSELRKKLEHHLRKRLILQRWGLPQRIRKSLSWMNPHAELPESSESQSSYGLSWISFFKQQDRSDLHNTALNQSVRLLVRTSETNSVEEDVEKEQGQTPEIIQTYCSWNNCQGASDNSLQSDSETAVHLSGSLPGQPSRTSQENQWQKETETALQRHVIWNLEKIKESQILGTVSRTGPCPSPVGSPVGKEGQEAQGQSPSHNKDERVKSTYGMTSGRQPVQEQAPSVIGKANLKESREGQRRSPELPISSTETVPQPKDKIQSSSNKTQILQETRLNDKKLPISNMTSSIIKGEQLCGVQPQLRKTLNSSPCKNSPGTDGNVMEA